MVSADVSRKQTLPAPGTRIGSLRVVRTLGVGGMGGVLLAYDEILEREVAVKMVLPRLLDKGESRENFIAEGRAMAAVRHENVVRIFDYGEHGDLPYLVMEYVPGETLEQRLEGHPGGLDADEALGVIEHVCRGLEAIHEAGIVHGDVKPSNVLIGPSFRVCLSDFGMTSSATVGSGAGTAAYMAPELTDPQPRSPELRARADLYALGVVAYEALAGDLPFDAPDSARMMAQHIYKQPAPLRSHRPDLPVAFEDLVARLLIKDPNERVPSSAEALRLIGLARRALPRTGQRRMLVVDDDPAFLALVRACVESELPGVDVVTVTSATRALEVAQETPFHLVVADLDMPELNGLELTASLRSEPNPPRVLVVTGEGAARDWRVLSHMGADGFLLKPVSPDSLVASIERLLFSSPRDES